MLKKLFILKLLLTILCILFNNSDLLSKSEMAAINESVESINNELIWRWNENELVVPQCEDIEVKELEESTSGLDWQAIIFMRMRYYLYM